MSYSFNAFPKILVRGRWLVVCVLLRITIVLNIHICRKCIQILVIQKDEEGHLIKIFNFFPSGIKDLWTKPCMHCLFWYWFFHCFTSIIFNAFCCCLGFRCYVHGAILKRQYFKSFIIKLTKFNIVICIHAYITIQPKVPLSSSNNFNDSQYVSYNLSRELSDTMCQFLALQRGPVILAI